MDVQHLNPHALHSAPDLLTQVVTVADATLVHLSGQVAWDADGRPVGSDHAAQAAQVARNIDTALASVGADRGHIVREVVYVADYTPDVLAPVLAALRRGAPAPPASTLVPVPALFAPGFLVEAEVTAALPPRTDADRTGHPTAPVIRRQGPAGPGPAHHRIHRHPTEDTP